MLLPFNEVTIIVFRHCIKHRNTSIWFWFVGDNQIIFLVIKGAFQCIISPIIIVKRAFHSLEKFSSCCGTSGSASRPRGPPAGGSKRCCSGCLPKNRKWPFLRAVSRPPKRASKEAIKEVASTTYLHVSKHQSFCWRKALLNLHSHQIIF